jgi:hypothetical protein
VAQRVAYTNLWIVGTSLALGLTPIAVGQLIDRWGLAGFRVCFVASGLSGLVCAAALGCVTRDSLPVERLVTPLLKLVTPVRVLFRARWIAVAGPRRLAVHSNRETTAYGRGSREPLPFRRGVAVPRGLSVCGCACERVRAARRRPRTANRTMKSPRPACGGSAPLEKG